jgi:hypothetical protein
MTILGGMHTVPELRWLVDSRDYFTRQVQNKINLEWLSWHDKDGPAADQWLAEWAKFGNRYNDARGRAMDKITAAKYMFTTPDDLIVAENEWNGIIRAFQQVPYTRTKGDFGDLVRRLGDVGIKVSFDKIPIDDTVDYDLKVYKTTDDVLKGIEDTAKKATKSLFSSPYFYLALGAVGVGGVVAVKVLK